jgi:hypothetical protein
MSAAVRNSAALTADLGEKRGNEENHSFYESFASSGGTIYIV